MSIYASTTSVPVHKSRLEIERILMRYGAHSFAYAAEAAQAIVMFRASDRLVRFILPLKTPAEFRYKKDSRGRDIPYQEHPKARQESMLQQDHRTRWRCLLLVIKSKLEAIATGIESFDTAFLAHIVLPNDKTVGQAVIPRLAEACPKGVFLLEALP